MAALRAGHSPHLAALNAQPAVCQRLQVILPVASGELLPGSEREGVWVGSCGGGTKTLGQLKGAPTGPLVHFRRHPCTRLSRQAPCATPGPGMQRTAGPGAEHAHRHAAPERGCAYRGASATRAPATSAPCRLSLSLPLAPMHPRTLLKMSMMFWPNQRCRTLQQKSKW